MYKIVLILLTLLLIKPAFAEVFTTTGLAPNYGNYRTPLNMQTINSYNKVRTRYNNLHRPCLHCNNQEHNILPKNGLNALEKYSMNKTFRRDNDLSRLARLEELAFGAEQVGNPITRYQNVETAILSRPQYNTKRSMLSNLANYFVGQATGFTPNLNPSDMTFFPTYSSPQNFNNRRYDQYSNGIFSGGYKFSDGGFGNQSVIRMLD